MDERSGIREIKGIGEKAEKNFAKAGIRTVGDLIRYYPRGYEVYEDPVSIGELEEGHTMTVSGGIYGRVQVSGSPKMQITTLYVKDLTGTLKVIWFRMPFLRNTLSRGGSGHPAGQGRAEKGRACDGAPGDLLSQYKI